MFGVLDLVLGDSVLDRQGHRVQQRAVKMMKGLEKRWLKGNLSRVHEHLKGGVVTREPGSSQWCPMTGKGATGTGRNTENRRNNEAG